MARYGQIGNNEGMDAVLSKGIVDSYAGLDGTRKVPVAQLVTYGILGA